jgi:hypothetical protein
MADRGAHPFDQMGTPLGDRDPQPSVFGGAGVHPGGPGGGNSVLKPNSGPQSLERLFRRNAFDLDEVDALDLEARVHQLVGQLAVIG